MCGDVITWSLRREEKTIWGGDDGMEEYEDLMVGLGRSGKQWVEHGCRFERSRCSL